MQAAELRAKYPSLTDDSATRDWTLDDTEIVWRVLMVAHRNKSIA